MATGKEMRRKARPANAGLNRLQPSPPNVIFTTPIAKKAPITIIQGAILLGRLKASRIPVRIAEPSHTIQFLFFMQNLLIAHSKNTQDATLMAVVMIAPMPNEMNEHSKAGIKAMITRYIFLDMV